MMMPRFTGESSLYQTSRYYRTGVQENNRSASSVRAVYPAMEMEEEVINVHGCPPGWSDIGGSCWPNPLTEPSESGSGGGMPGEPSGGGSGGGGVDSVGDY